MDYVYYKKDNGEYSKLNVEFNFSQVYNNAIDVVGSIRSACAMHLLFWVLSNMDENNTVALRKNEKLSFISKTLTHGNKYSLSAVNKAVKILIDKDILISRNYEGQRLGAYVVNPMYFWKIGSQDERKSFIANVLQFKKWKQEDEKNRNTN